MDLYSWRLLANCLLSECEYVLFSKSSFMIFLGYSKDGSSLRTYGVILLSFRILLFMVYTYLMVSTKFLWLYFIPLP